MIKFVFLAVLLFVAQCRTAAEDKVAQFPLFGPVNFDIYSGMLNVTDTGSRALHYVLLESQHDPQNSPLVIWLNGGPGCSSLLGLMQEVGPYLFQGLNTNLTDNLENSWNQRANVLYIEGPPGVGFSPNHESIFQYRHSDANTSQDFLTGLNVFRDRFNTTINFQNPLYISGESYAGMYIPYLSKAILDFNAANPAQKHNLKGFLIGNGVFNMNKFNLLRDIMKTYVIDNFFNVEGRQLFKGCEKSLFNIDCQKFQNIYNNVQNNTDRYSIYNYTYSYSNPGALLTQQSDFLINSLVADEPILKDMYFGNKQVNEDNTGTPMQIIAQYFNQQHVKEALHVDTSMKWDMCNLEINAAYKHGKPSIELYPEFIKAGLDIMIFSGNDDSMVPWFYTNDNIDSLINDYGIKFTEVHDFKQWVPTRSKQVGGMTQKWTTPSGSTFIHTMVRAAGHEVPMYQPNAAYYMFQQFLDGKDI